MSSQCPSVAALLRPRSLTRYLSRSSVVLLILCLATVSSARAQTVQIGAPQGLEAVASSRKVGLTWRASDSSHTVGYYEVRWAARGSVFGSWHRKDIRASDTSFRHLVDGLANETTYVFQVRAHATVNGAPHTGEAAEAEATPMLIGPPLGLSAEPRTTEVVLTWRRPSTTLIVQYFEIRWRAGGGGFTAWQRKNVGSRDQSFEHAVTGVDQRHELHVRGPRLWHSARCPGGVS